MQPGKLDLDIYRGDSYKWVFTLWTDAAKTVAADLTGAVALVEIRVSPGSSVICTPTMTITMPNIINMTITAAMSASLPAAAKWDLQITQAGNVTTILAGSVTNTSDITGSVGAFMAMAPTPQTVTVRRAI
jgi:hypothetical protein